MNALEQWMLPMYLHARRESRKARMDAIARGTAIHEAIESAHAPALGIGTRVRVSDKALAYVVTQILMGCVGVRLDGIAGEFAFRRESVVEHIPSEKWTVADVPPCPECHGRGSVELFMSVSPCSRGCRVR